MTNTVSIKADHLGTSRPYVVGHQYVVLADCDITSYRTGTTATSGSPTINADNVTKTFTTDDASFVSDGFVVGDHVTFAGSAAGNNSVVFKLSAVTADDLTTTQAVTVDAGDGDEIVTHAGEKVLASSFGLTSITSVELVGQENHDCNFIIGDVSADGSYFYLYAYTTGSAALLSASLKSGDIGVATLKVTGKL